MSSPCPDWSQPEPASKLPSVTLGNALIAGFIQKRATSVIVNHGTLRNWHRELFKSVVPLTYYAGNFRCHDPSRPCLGQQVWVGPHTGSDYHIVANEMDAYSVNLYSYIQQTDSYIAGQMSFANKVHSSLQLASWAVGRFIQIHPFLNGNGRISLFATIWVSCLSRLLRGPEAITTLQCSAVWQGISTGCYSTSSYC
jgi:fido (protein-threonine AMPylation protein)